VSDNVVHAFGAVPMSQLQQEMLEHLDPLIADIKAGQLLGVAFAGVTRDGGVTHSWTRAKDQHFALIGAVQRLSQRLLDDGHDP